MRDILQYYFFINLNLAHLWLLCIVIKYAPSGKSENDIDSTIKELHSHIDSGDRKMLVATYTKLQSIYKTASKEDKVKILQECNLIRQKLSKK